MANNNTQQATAAVDVLAVLDKDLNQVFPGVRPVKATIKEESKPMEHPLETGALVTDHRIILPVDIELSTVVAAEDYREVFRQVKDIYLRGDLLTVQTRTDSYTSMLIASMPHEETGDMQDGITLIITLREAKFVTAEFKDMKIPPPKPAAKKNTDTVKRGEQRPTETPEPRKGSYLSKLNLLGRK
jgi:hypothetical protein